MVIPRKPADDDDNDYAALEARVSELEVEVIDLRMAKKLTEEDIKYIREARLAAAHAGWAWQQIRTYTPWIISITSALGAGIYWILTHITLKSGGGS